VKIVLLVALALCTARAQERALSTIREIRALSVAEAEREPVVRLRAVVTMRYAYRHATYIHDGTGGIYLRLRDEDVPPGLAAGSLLEIEGVAGAGNFATEIAGPKWTSAKVKVIGNAPLPEPQRVTPNEFMEPALSSQWVEIEAQVDDMQVREGIFQFQARAGNRLFSALAPSLSPADESLWQLAGRRVRLLGVVGTVFNRHRQMTARLLFVHSITPLDSIPPSTAGDSPLLRPGELFRTDVPTPLTGIRVRGVVTALRPGLGFHLRGENGALLVESTSEDVRAGSEVEVAGVPQMEPFRPVIRAHGVTVIAQQAAPAPLRVGLKDVGEGLFHHEFVELEGEFLGVRRGASMLSYQLRQDGVVFWAQMKLTNPPPPLSEIQPGSTLRIRGILLNDAENPQFSSVVGPDFYLRLLEPSGLQIIAVPPWWTVRRVLWLLAGVGALGGLAALWALMLKRRVAEQSVIIHGPAVREANERERGRIAQNIHDDLGSRLTQLSLLGTRVMDAAETGPAAELGERIATLARGTVATMDEIVWAVNPRYDSLQSLADYLCRLAPSLLASGAVRCELDVPAVLPPHLIRPETRHGLVLALREAITNILKHARAAISAAAAGEAGGDQGGRAAHRLPARALRLAPVRVKAAPADLDRLGQRAHRIVGDQAETSSSRETYPGCGR